MGVNSISILHDLHDLNIFVFFKRREDKETKEN